MTVSNATMKPKDGGALKVLTLSLSGQLFALDAASVREILDLAPVTEVPASTPFASGLINVRGKVVPLTDLRHKLGMEIRSPTIDTRIVVLEIDIDGDLTSAGILADKVHEVTDIPAADLEETPKIGLPWRPGLIRCIGKRGGGFIAVLDIARIFSSAHQQSRFSRLITAQSAMPANLSPAS
jgi:purine-binding chemotaxis protein CheW